MTKIDTNWCQKGKTMATIQAYVNGVNEVVTDFEYDAVSTLRRLYTLEDEGVVSSAAALTEKGVIQMFRQSHASCFVLRNYTSDLFYIRLLSGDVSMAGETQVYIKLDTSKLEAERDALQAKIDRINALKIQPVTTD